MTSRPTDWPPPSSPSPQTCSALSERYKLARYLNRKWRFSGSSYIFVGSCFSNISSQPGYPDKSVCGFPRFLQAWKFLYMGREPVLVHPFKFISHTVILQSNVVYPTWSQLKISLNTQESVFQLHQYYFRNQKFIFVSTEHYPKPFEPTWYFQTLFQYKSCLRNILHLLQVSVAPFWWLSSPTNRRGWSCVHQYVPVLILRGSTPILLYFRRYYDYCNIKFSSKWRNWMLAAVCTVANFVNFWVFLSFFRK